MLGKFKYLLNIIKNYTNWFYIINCRIFNNPIEKIILKNGIVFSGGKKSLTIDIVDEIFINEVYNPNFLKIKQNDTVVDIGSNIGIFSLYAALNGATKIFSVEPLESNLKFIRKNFLVNNLIVPKIINVAVSNKNGVSKLYLPDYDSHGLLFEKNNIKKFNKYVKVKTINFSKLLNKYNIKKIDFLKIDCEGSEGYILSSSSKEDWKYIKKVAIEYHNGVSILNSEQLLDKLKKFGFKTQIKESDKLFGYIYAWK